MSPSQPQTKSLGIRGLKIHVTSEHSKSSRSSLVLHRQFPHHDVLVIDTHTSSILIEALLGSRFTGQGEVG